MAPEADAGTEPTRGGRASRGRCGTTRRSTRASGYGAFTIRDADGSSRESFRIGLSATATGIAVYVPGLADKTYLARTHGASIGRASVTGCSIRFPRLAVIDTEALHAAIHDGMTTDQHG